MNCKRGIIPVLVAGGIAAGFVNGLLGTGGGIILIFLLSKLLGNSSDFDTKDIFATVVAIILPMSFVSALCYTAGQSVTFSDAVPYIIPGIIGGILGGILLDIINTNALKKLFAIMVIYAGVRMIL